MYRQSIYNLPFSNSRGHFYYNSLSGQLIKGNDDLTDYMEHIESNSDAESFEYFRPLFEKGFIVNKSLDEYARMIALKNELLYSSQDIQASYVVALTTVCNCKCVYCYEEGAKIGRMSKSTGGRIVDFIIGEAERNKILREIKVTWFGGEPLLEPEIIEYIGDRIKAYCDKEDLTFSTNIITNGVLLDENALRLLNRYNLQNIQITFDGQKECYNRYKRPMSVNAYETVLQNIRMASGDNQITIRLNCAKDNYGSIKELCREMIHDPQINLRNCFFSLSKINMQGGQCLSVEEFSDNVLDFISFLAENDLTDQVQKYLPIPKTIPCGLMKRSSFVIDNEGFLYKCEHYVGNPRFSVGNVFDGLLYPPFQTDFESTPFKEECRGCAIFPLCRGGCSQKRFVGETSVACMKKRNEITTILERIISLMS